MAANNLLKQIAVQFDELLVGFDDQLVTSKNVETFNVPGETFQRSSDVIWRKLPTISTSGNGIDATTDFTNASATQLSVPASVGFQKHSVFALNGLELRDALSQKTLLAGAKRKLSSDINVAVNNAIGLQGSLCVKRTTPSVGYDDWGIASALMDERGISMFDRKAVMAPRDYNSAAGNLASRQTLNDLPRTAYEKARINADIAGFEMFKEGYTYRQPAALGVGVTLTSSNQYYTPAATTTQSDGSVTPKENRYQIISVTVSSGAIAVGDRFQFITANACNSVHQITKQDTGQPMTFVVNRIVTGAGGTGTIEISPPIISGTGGTPAELQYKNCTAIPAAGAGITFLNTVATSVNPFWQKQAVEIIPCRYEVPNDMGLKSMTGTTDQGITLTMSYRVDLFTLNMQARVDCLFGVVVNQPQQVGVMLFNQT
jgi:hypothetical protein